MATYSCPKCLCNVVTAKKGDIETCKKCFTTSYLDKNNNSVKVGHNDYAEKISKSNISDR
ncbi:hypothetical protein LCGC14_0175330 [marine sediment metagenome]|uniref:Uncharacterized protein n=1 Tax=marine sediment metagenome TaxID=412755 RepID=A0A0F9UV97_9ZZZZ